MSGLVKTPEGWEYQSEKWRYSLYEGETIESQGAFSSDLLFIMDDCYLEREPELVGWLWGASFVRDPKQRGEWEKNIAEFVNRYENKANLPNGLKRMEHIQTIVQAYLETNEEVMQYEEEDRQEVIKIKEDIEYLKLLIERIKEMKR